MARPLAYRRPRANGGAAPLAPRVAIADILSLVRLAATTAVWLCVAALVVYYGWTGAVERFVSAIDVTHIEAFGVKVNVDREKSRLLNDLEAKNQAAEDGSRFDVDGTGVLAALKRAEINAGAIRGSRLLWVDDLPANNAIVIDLLSRVGITVVAVTSNDAALDMLRASAFDAVVTDGRREKEERALPRRPLVACPLRYVAVPTLTAGSLDALNARVAGGEDIPAGFRLAEDIARDDASAGFASIAVPRIIMYSASNGEISYNPCFRTITRSTGALFHAIVSTLEESRQPVTSAPPAAATAPAIGPPV